MADSNFVRFNRFTAQPSNIADFGSTVEEVQLQRGAPDKNPAVSPMAVPRMSQLRLFLKPGGSDQLRLGQPAEPPVDPYEGPQSTLSLSRSALRKLGGSILDELASQVQATRFADNDTRGLMLDSFRRVTALRTHLAETNAMAENIYVRSVAASRG